jgi:uncharacterized membrane protein
MKRSMAALIVLGVLTLGTQAPGLVKSNPVSEQPAEVQPPPVLTPTLTSPKPQPLYTDVAAIFNRQCVTCHSGRKPAERLRLDTYAGIMAGSKNGPVVVAGDPEKSELVRRIRGVSKPRMPLKGPPWVSEEDTALIEQWIATGANEK